MQWKGRRSHPYGWWFGTVQSVRGNRVVLLFRCAAPARCAGQRAQGGRRPPERLLPLCQSRSPLICSLRAELVCTDLSGSWTACAACCRTFAVPHASLPPTAAPGLQAVPTKQRVAPRTRAHQAWRRSGREWGLVIWVSAEHPTPDPSSTPPPSPKLLSCFWTAFAAGHAPFPQLLPWRKLFGCMRAAARCIHDVASCTRVHPT